MTIQTTSVTKQKSFMGRHEMRAYSQNLQTATMIQTNTQHYQSRTGMVMHCDADQQTDQQSE